MVRVGRPMSVHAYMHVCSDVPARESVVSVRKCFVFVSLECKNTQRYPHCSKPQPTADKSDDKRCVTKPH